MVHYESFLTRQRDGINAAGQMEKRFTVQISATELVATKTEGRVEAEPREGEPTIMRASRLLSAMAFVVLQRLLRAAAIGQCSGGYRPRQPDRDQGRGDGRDSPLQ